MTGEPIGAYVGKVVLNADLGAASLAAYQRVRPIAHHPSLAGVYETAREYSADRLIALLRWVDGTPLGDLADVLTLHAAELGRGEGLQGAERLLLGWAMDPCGALAVLHEHGLVHGDVSPGNIIVHGDLVTLIDYDLLTMTGGIAPGQGTPPVAAPAVRLGEIMSPADDLFALGASFFQVLFDRDPFIFDGTRSEGRGLAWQSGEREAIPMLAEFLDRAVTLDPARRFADARSALDFLRLSGEGRDSLPVLPPLRPNVVPRLKDILRAYPGSRYGNAETRGLDTPFAHETYVTTRLDEVIRDDIQAARASLAILCGNAGDGKTAFLQHLASNLGVGELNSEQRVWETRLADGLALKINLDGAAAWRGRDADSLMDELFEPFHQGPPKDRRAHMVGVNDGRLMEWVESYERRHDGHATPLTRQIVAALADQVPLDSHIRLVELNLRSLVGGLGEGGVVSTDFVDRLIDRMIGGQRASDIWQSCLTCTAQKRCPMRLSAQRMGASKDAHIREEGRRRLTDALQAVHQRGEVHITARELKAALSYILFGTLYGTDLHDYPDLVPPRSYDLAFDPLLPRRQGELLRELTRLDPALEGHAQLDRYLTGRGGPDPRHGTERYPELTRNSARRRAYFEWTDGQIAEVGGYRNALGLVSGARLQVFRDFPLLPETHRDVIRNALCNGLSRLEALPSAAFRRIGFVPVRIVPRTPTETAFWVNKPLDRFSLEAERFKAAQGLETLHRHLVLSYRFNDERVESLIISLELFDLLMDLYEGVQIIDAFSDDIFANLGVFTQRLTQEDATTILAWNPAAEDRVFSIEIQNGDSNQQVLAMRSVPIDATV